MTNTPENRAHVTVSRHITVETPPNNWRELAEFADWRNMSGQLCCFVSIERKDGTFYLSSSVY